MEEKHYYLVYIIDEEYQDASDRFENAIVVNNLEKAKKLADKMFKEHKEQYEIGVSEIFEKEVYIAQWRSKNESY